VIVIARFDRDYRRRVPLLSTTTLLALPQDASASYTMIADVIRQYGDDVRSDLRELWRRLVFSLLASNYDDHPRNHGFLMLNRNYWSLSPAYDLNPVPEIERARTAKTAISEDEPDLSIEAALSVLGRFGLNIPDGKIILKEVFGAVSKWRQAGRQLRLNASTLDLYSTAFETPLLDEARRILRL
jgi:serine/threonine-protein kinase HipA